MDIYLDINDTLLTHDLKPGDGLKIFLEYFSKGNDLYWLSTHCKGVASVTMNYLKDYLPPDILKLLRRVKPTNWVTLKTEAIDFSKEFLWFDDFILHAEQQILIDHLVSNSWAQISLRREPDGLLKWVERKGIAPKQLDLNSIDKENFNIQSKRPKITFFHNSDNNCWKFPSLFKPRLRKENGIKETRPVFYWFSDSWHSHWGNHRDKYLYFFVKNPKEDGVQFNSRHEGFEFHGLYSHFLEYLKNRGGIGPDPKKYMEPSILMSFSDIEPDLAFIFENSQDRYGTVIYPKEYQGVKINFFDEQDKAIKFTDIPEILLIIPQIRNSYPFIEPKFIDGKYEYEDWVPMSGRRAAWL